MIRIAEPIIGQEEKDAVMSVLDSGMLAQGPKTKELEDKFAALCGTEHAIAVSNGTAALHTALHSEGIKEGDEVITTPFTFIASVNSVLMAGARPVFADIDPETFNIDPNYVEAVVTPRTRAILAVNLYGQPADYEALHTIAKKHKLVVIEDAAQSVGAKYKERTSGNFGNIATFSLYATKNIMSGEGGMITTNDARAAETARRFRHHGMGQVRYQYEGLGYNYRMTDLQSAIALAQLGRLDWINTRRQEIAKRYNDELQNIPGLVTPKTADERTHVFHQYTVRVTEDYKMDRNTFSEKLAASQIASAIFYPIPLYQFDHLTKFSTSPSMFPVTEKVSREVLSLPVHPKLSDEDIDYVIKTIKEL